MLAQKAERGEDVESADVMLLPANYDAARIYMLVRRQVISIGEGVIVDLNIPAVKIAMDLERVENQADCLRRVLKVFHHFEEQRRNNAA